MEGLSKQSKQPIGRPQDTQQCGSLGHLYTVELSVMGEAVRDEA